MYTRSLLKQKHSFFLFGPRGVGKSTWIRQEYPDAMIIDLLPPDELLRYTKNPGLLTAKVSVAPKNRWIVVDEIQKVPSLLDEVHHLMENKGYKNFVLSGSSARKLKRGSANMLGGRANTKSLYPLNAKELNFSFDPHQVLHYGMLPLSLLPEDPAQKEAFLRSYLTTYINEEIRAEGLVRDIGHFSRFLDIAALMAGRQVNVLGLARDAGISRDTVQGYFSVFEDTLLGSYLYPYRPRAKVKEVAKPKFYWFDSGVLHAAAGGFDQPMPKDWQGVLLEHLVHHELKSYLDYAGVRGTLGYWRTPSGTEVDFVWWYGDEVVGIEVKHSQSFRKEFLKGLKSLRESLPLKKAYLVYFGQEELLIDDVLIIPVMNFLKKLHAGEVLGLGVSNAHL